MTTSKQCRGTREKYDTRNPIDPNVGGGMLHLMRALLLARPQRRLTMQTIHVKGGDVLAEDIANDTSRVAIGRGRLQVLMQNGPIAMDAVDHQKGRVGMRVGTIVTATAIDNHLLWEGGNHRFTMGIRVGT